MLRSTISVIAGVIAGVMVIALVEKLGHLIYPPPSNVNFNDPEALKEVMKNIPAGALLSIIIAWALGSLVGGAVASGIAVKSPVVHAFIVSAVIMGASIANLIMIPHPLWFAIMGLAVIIPFAFLGTQIATMFLNKNKS